MQNESNKKLQYYCLDDAKLQLTKCGQFEISTLKTNIKKMKPPTKAKIIGFMDFRN